MTDFDDKNGRFVDPEDDYEDYNEPETEECEEEDDDEEEYAVGYCNPPKHTRFKKGQSGNPMGRPKASANQSESLAKELSKTIAIRENGQAKNVKIMDAIAKKAVALALQGNISILKMFLSNPIIDPCLFKDAIFKYNTDKKDIPKPLSPELRLIVNKAKELGRELHSRETEKRERGEIE